MADIENNKNANSPASTSAPALRFPGFTEPWKPVTLGDITHNFSRRNKECKECPMYSVTNNRGFIPQNEQFEDREMVGEDIKSYKIIEYGEFAYNPARINVGSIARYTGSEPCMISSLYVCFKPSNEIDGNFLMQFLKSPKAHFYYNANGEGGVRIYLFYPNFARIRTAIPSLSEQRKISSLLSIIDERIATQRRLIEDLQKLKSSIAHHLFQQNAPIIPLGELASVTNGNADVQDAIENYEIGLYPFFDRSEQVKYLDKFYLDKVAIIYAGEGQNFFPRYFEGKFALHQRCYAIYNFDERLLPRYCYHYMQQLNRYFQKTAVGSTVASLRMDSFLNAPIKLPSILTQKNITSVLDSIEDLALVEQRLLSNYVHQRQYLLCKLFI